MGFSPANGSKGTGPFGAHIKKRHIGPPTQILFLDQCQIAFLKQSSLSIVISTHCCLFYGKQLVNRINETIFFWKTTSSDGEI